jgi:hypothetical protein
MPNGALGSLPRMPSHWLLKSLAEQPPSDLTRANTKHIGSLASTTACVVMPSFLIRRPSLTLAAVGLLSTKQQSPTQLHKMLTEATAWFELKVSVPNAALI